MPTYPGQNSRDYSTYYAPPTISPTQDDPSWIPAYYGGKTGYYVPNSGHNYYPTQFTDNGVVYDPAGYQRALDVYNQHRNDNPMFFPGGPNGKGFIPMQVPDGRGGYQWIGPPGFTGPLGPTQLGNGNYVSIAAIDPNSPDAQLSYQQWADKYHPEWNPNWTPPPSTNPHSLNLTHDQFMSQYGGSGGVFKTYSPSDSSGFQSAFTGYNSTNSPPPPIPPISTGNLLSDVITGTSTPSGGTLPVPPPPNLNLPTTPQLNGPTIDPGAIVNGSFTQTNQSSVPPATPQGTNTNQTSSIPSLYSNPIQSGIATQSSQFPNLNLNLPQSGSNLGNTGNYRNQSVFQDQGINPTRNQAPQRSVPPWQFMTRFFR